MDTDNSQVLLELLDTAAEAAAHRDEREYIINLAASHVLDGISRKLKLHWPEVEGSIIEMVVAKAADALYAKLACGGVVRSPAGYLWGAANNQLRKLHREGALAGESLDESLKKHNQAHSSVFQEQEHDNREAMLIKAIRFARAVLPSLGQTMVVRVMTFIIDCVEQGEPYIDNKLIAESLGLTTEAVRKAKHRGFERLKREAERRGIRLGDMAEISDEFQDMQEEN